MRAVTVLATEIVDSTVESRLARLEVDAARLTPDDGGLFGDETLVLRQSHERSLGQQDCESSTMKHAGQSAAVGLATSAVPTDKAQYNMQTV